MAKKTDDSVETAVGCVEAAACRLHAVFASDCCGQRSTIGTGGQVDSTRFPNGCVAEGRSDQ